MFRCTIGARIPHGCVTAGSHVAFQFARTIIHQFDVTEASARAFLQRLNNEGFSYVAITQTLRMTGYSVTFSAIYNFAVEYRASAKAFVAVKRFAALCGR